MAINLPTLVQKVLIDTSSMRKAEKAAQGYEDSLGDVEAASESAEQSQGDLTAAMDDAADSHLNAADAADEHSEALDRNAGASRDAASATRDHTAANRDSAAAHREASESTDRDTSVLRRNTNERKKSNTEVIHSAARLVQLTTGMELVGHAVGFMKFPVMLAAVPALTTAVGALGTAFMGLTSQIAPAAGILGAAPGALLAGASAMFVLKSAIGGPMEAAKAIQQYGAASKQAQEAMKELGPLGKQTAIDLAGMRDSFDGIKRAASEAALPGLRTVLAGVGANLPTLKTGLEGVGTAISESTKPLGEFMQSAGFMADFGTIMGSNAKVVGLLGKALTPIAKIITDIMVTAGPMLEQMAAGVGAVAENLAAMSAGWRASGGMAAFFQKAFDTAKQLWHVIRDLGAGLFNIFKQSDALGIDFIGNLEKGAAIFREWTSSEGGIKILRDTFASYRPVLHEVWLLIKDVAMMFGRMATDKDTPNMLADMVSSIRTDVLPVFESLVMGARDFLPAIVPVITAFVTLSNALPFSPFSTFITILAEAATVLGEFLADHPLIAKFAAALLLLSTAMKGIRFIGMVTGLTGMIGSLRTGIGVFRGTTEAAGFFQTRLANLGAQIRAAGLASYIRNIGLGFKSAAIYVKDYVTQVGRFVATQAVAGVKGLGSALKTTGLAMKSAAIFAAQYVRNTASFLATSAIAGVKGLGTALKTAGTAMKVAATNAALYVKMVGRFAAVQALAGIKAMGAGLKAFGLILKTSVIPAVWSFTVALLANPITWIVIGIVALVAAFIWLWKNVEGFRNFWIKLWEGIKSVLSAVWNFIKVVFSAIWTVIKTYVLLWWKIISTYVKLWWTVFSTVVKFIWNIVKTVFTAIWNFLVTVFTAIWAVIKFYVTVWWTIISAVVKLIWLIIKNTFMSIWNFLSFVFNAIWTVIKMVVMGWWTIISTVVKLIWNIISTVFTAVWNFIKTVFTAIWNFISMVVTAWWNVISTVFTAIWNFIKTILTAIWTVIQTVLNIISTVWSAIWNTIKSVLVAVWDAIKAAVGAAVNWVKDNVISRIQALYDKWKSMWQGFKDIISDIWNGIKSAIQTVVDWIKSKIDWIGDKLKWVGDKLKSIPVIGGIFGKAIGGAVREGQAYMVGERGPELFVPWQSGKIVPNHDLQRSLPAAPGVAAGGVGGGSTVNYIYNINVSETTGPTTEEALLRTMRKVAMAGSATTTVGSAP